MTRCFSDGAQVIYTSGMHWHSHWIVEEVFDHVTSSVFPMPAGFSGKFRSDCEAPLRELRV